MKTLFTCLNLIFLTVAIYFSVTLVYDKIENAFFTLSAISTHEREDKNALKIEAQQQRSQDRSTIITQRNLFKAAIMPATTAEMKGPEIQDKAKLAPTTLNLKLWGTVAGIGSQSFAVIQEDKAKPQMLYHEGDTVARAIVKQILRSSVILTYNGQDQILEMESEGTKSSAAPPPAMTKPDNDETAITVERSVIDDAINDMETLAKQVRVRPHFSGGKPDGLLIYGMSNNPVFTKLGLKNGDIIMGVDGRELNSISDALSLYQTLNQASGANLKIKRRGKIKEIVYNVQQ